MHIIKTQIKTIQLCAHVDIIVGMVNNDKLRNVADEIKMRMPMLTFLERHGYDVKPSGPNRFKMLCPFHSEKTPSCMVPPPEGIQTCHCFGCGESFDIFSFMEKTEGIPFMDGVEMLAEELNIDYHNDDYDTDATPRKTIREILLLTSKALKNLYDRLPDDHAAKRQVSKRNIPVDNACNHDLFGWAPEDDKYVVNALMKKGFTEKQLIESGVAHKWEDGSLHFPWRARLMFVIRDMSGNPIGFTGRIVYDDDKSKGKYVNSADNPVFHKSNVLFCEDIARKQANVDKTVYVVEGQFDVIACQHAGKLNTVASSGTAFTTEHANLLRRMVTPDGRIVFMFDADEAGQKAALRTFKAVPVIQAQSYATIPLGDKDASDMYRDDPQALLRQLDNVHPLYHHIIDWLASKHNLADDNGRRVFINECMDAYETISDPILADNFIAYVSLKSGADSSSLKRSAWHGKDKNNRKPSDVFIDGNADDLQPEDYILALAIEQKELRQRLIGLPMAKRYRIIQEKIANDNLNLSELTLNRLQTATEMMRQFEGYAPVVDIDGLFEDQITLLESKRRMDTAAAFHAKHMPAMDSRISSDNTRVYAEKFREIMEREN